jgi:arylsulfatase A-like enzyme
VTTLLTGLLPSKHGVEGCLSAPPLLGAVASLAEYLRAAGYATEAMTGGGWVSAEVGHSQGFERFSGNWSFADEKGTLARWARSRDRAKPSFLFLHTYDAHDPYGRKRPPAGEGDPEKEAEAERLVERLKPFVGAGGAGGAVGGAVGGGAGGGPAGGGPDLGDAAAKELVLAWRADPLKHRRLERAFEDGRFQGIVLRYDVATFPTSPDRDEVASHLREKYRAGLAFTDGLFAGVLRLLDEAALPPNTVTIVVSDHGESFGEHENLGHGRWMYDEVTRVVFLVRAPGKFAPRDVSASVGLVDVVPTVLDLCGLPPPRGLDGRSILRVLEGRGAGHPVRAEDHRFAFEGASRVGLRTASVRDDRAKWIVTWDPRKGVVREEVYDLSADPAEKNPLGPDAVARFGAEFEAEVSRSREAAKAWRSRDEGQDVRPKEGE